MEISSILPLLGALAATAKAVYSTRSCHINSLPDERYFFGIYNESSRGLRVKIHIREPTESANKNE